VGQVEWLGSEIFKAVLTFDNGLTYTSRSDYKDCDGILLQLQVDESEAATSGNPVGIMTPNYCNLTIWDLQNRLIPTNTNSPYYGYMRNGVFVELYISIDGGNTWLDYGKYYTENWSVVIENGGAKAASITCTDKLAFIGNREIPKLSAYSGVDVVDLLKEIFSAIGVSTDEYNIDPSLEDKVSMLVSITKGDLLRDVLNTIAQALLARITIDRSGVIQVKPAFPNIDDYGELNSLRLQNMQIEHNQLSVYNRVTLSYNEVDNNQPSSIIYQQNNVRLNPGENRLDNISIQQNILSIDGVYIDLDATAESYIDQIGVLDYSASQNGINITVVSNLTEPVYVSVTVEGRIAGLTNSFVESEVKDTDVKVSNTLAIESFVIQDRNVAQTYVNEVAKYLGNMQQEVVVSGALSPLITTGVYITINTGEPSFDGRYLVTKFSMSIAFSRVNVTLTMVKMRGA